MRQVRALEVHWYLIINQAFFSIYSRKSVISYFLINVNEAGPWTGSALVFNLKPAFFEIYKILLDTDKQKSWRELTVQ